MPSFNNINYDPEDLKRLIALTSKITNFEIKEQSNDKEIVMGDFLAPDNSGSISSNLTIKTTSEQNVEIVNHSCDCISKYMDNSQMCDHCLALEFKYLLSKKENNKNKKVDNSTRSSEITSTSESISNAISSEEEPYFGDNGVIKNSIMCIKPEFTIRYNRDNSLNYMIRLFISDGHTKCKVKDIHQFLSDIENNKENSYGNTISFLHNLEAFDQNSRNLIKLISNGILYDYRDEDGLFKIKDKDLVEFPTSNMPKLLSALIGHKLKIHDNTYFVTDKKPIINAHIHKYNNGAEFYLDTYKEIVNGNKYWIADNSYI